MAEIIVKSGAIREKAETFRSIAESIKNYTEEMKQIVDNLKSIWEGEASEETRAAFLTKFQETFEEKYQTIIGYAKFLDEAADAYDRTEAKNKEQ